MGISLKKHNEEAYGKVKEMLKEGNKAAVVHPTGTGKTYIALKWIEESQGKTIYLAPSNHILNQVQETIEKARENGEISEEQYKRYKEVKYTTYTSLMELSKMEGGYDNIILDEFHRCGAPEWGKGVDRIIQSSPSAKIIGMSATPLRAVDNKDMADELFEGNIASEMTLEEAVAEGILEVPIYVSAIYSLEEAIMETESRIEKETDEEAKKELRKDIEKAKRYLEEAEGLDDIFAKYADKKEGKYIVFCSDIDDMHKKMQEASKWFAKVGETRLYEVSYKKSEELNEDTIKRFREEKGKINLLFSVDKLNEGVHVDGIDGVIMLRKTSSPIVYMQQLGRALSAGNEGTPLVFDLVNNIDSSRYVYEFMERVQQIMKERGIKDERIGRFKVYEQQRKIKDVLKNINEKLERNAKTVVAKTLKICKILYENGVDLSKIQLSKRIDGKDKYLLLSEIEQEGIDIQKIIEENGLDEEFKFGKSVITLRQAYNGTIRNPITEEEKREAEKLGLIQEKEESIVSQTLRICRVLYDNGVDLSKIKVTKRIDGKDKYLLLSEQEGIDIQKIIEENGLDGEFKFGQSIIGLRRAYKGTGNYAITEEEKQETEKLGLIPEKEESVIGKTLKICKILYENEVDLSKIHLSKQIDGKTKYLLLSEIEQEGIDIEKIIEENGLDGEFKFGQSVIYLRLAYNGIGKNSITEEEKQKAEELGIVQTEKESAIAQTLKVCRVLYNNEVDLSKIHITKRIEGKDYYFLLSEIEQEGIDIGKIIEENGLDGEFKFGLSVMSLRQAYNGTGSCAITEEEKKEAEKLGLVQKEKESIIAQTLRISKILYNNGVKLGKIQLQEDGKFFMLSEIQQDGIDIKKIIESNNLDKEFNYGKNVVTVRTAYNAKKEGRKFSSTITEEEMREAEKIGLIKEDIMEQTLRIAKILYENGVNLREIQLAKKGKTFLLSEIQQEGIDIQKIVKDNHLDEGSDEGFNYGQAVTTFRRVYNGIKAGKKVKGSITEEQMKEAERIGLVKIISKKVGEKLHKLDEVIQEVRKKQEQVSEAKQLESMYQQELESKKQKEGSDIDDDKK